MGWHRALASAPVAPPDALHTASSGLSSLSVYIYCLEQPRDGRYSTDGIASRSGGVHLRLRRFVAVTLTMQ